MKKIISVGNGTVIKSWSYDVIRQPKPVGKFFQLREYASFYAAMAGLVLLAVVVTVGIFAPATLQSTLSSLLEVL